MNQQRIVIIGGGIVGLAAAYALLSANAGEVIVLEREHVTHERGSSYGPSRLLRFEYGGDTLYTRMVQLSLERWQRLTAESGEALYTQTGVLSAGSRWNGTVQASLATLRGMGLSVEELSLDECRRRFPQFVLDHAQEITYNPGGGMLFASTCLRTLKRRILALGGRVEEHRRVTRMEYENAAQPVRVVLEDGAAIEADRPVVSSGPWVHSLLKSLRLPVRITRQCLLYYSGLSPSSYGAGAFPAFLLDDLYGFPLHDNGSGALWLKAGSHTFGAEVDPDERFTPDDAIISDVARRLQDVLPALREATLARIDTCMYDVSPDEDFIIDTLPDDPRVTFATGLSGHGFKFGPLLGEMIASLVRQEPSPIPLDRFRLSRFGNVHW